MAKTSPSKDRGEGLTPGQGGKITHDCGQEIKA